VTVPAAGHRLSRRTVDRYAELLEHRGEAVALANDTVFYKYRRMVEPMAPAGHDAGLTQQQARDLLDELGGVLVRWGSGFSEEDTGWYSIVCDDLLAVEDLPSRNARSKLRRGLKNCRAEQIDAGYLARHGYPVYASAFDRYSGRHEVDDESRFVDKIRRAAPFPDLVHYWGVFHADRLVGYSANYVFEDVEVSATEIKFDPAYLKHYSSYALMHRMTEHYLDAGVGSLNAGGRSLAHDTAFQDYLVDTFRYHKAFTRLRVAFSRPYALGLRATRPLRGVLGRADRRLDALYELHALSRSGR
jgi:hypothetical protein